MDKFIPTEYIDYVYKSLDISIDGDSNYMGLDLFNIWKYGNEIKIIPYQYSNQLTHNSKSDIVIGVSYNVKTNTFSTFEFRLPLSVNRSRHMIKQINDNTLKIFLIYQIVPESNLYNYETGYSICTYYLDSETSTINDVFITTAFSSLTHDFIDNTVDDSYMYFAKYSNVINTTYNIEITRVNLNGGGYISLGLTNFRTYSTQNGYQMSLTDKDNYLYGCIVHRSSQGTIDQSIQKYNKQTGTWEIISYSERDFAYNSLRGKWIKDNLYIYSALKSWTSSHWSSSTSGTNLKSLFGILDINTGKFKLLPISGGSFDTMNFIEVNNEIYCFVSSSANTYTANNYLITSSFKITPKRYILPIVENSTVNLNVDIYDIDNNLYPANISFIAKKNNYFVYDQTPISGEISY